MQFKLNETQEMLKDGARRFFTSEFDSQKARAIEQSADGFSADHWSQLAELGWSSLALPESVGGSGLGVLELCLLAEEMGRAAASTPLLVSSGLAATCLKCLPTNSLATELLSMLASSHSVFTAALIDSSGRDERTSATLQLAESADDFILSGRKQLVPYASIATVLLVSAQATNGEPVIVAVNNDSNDMSFTRHQTLGGDPLFDVHFNEVSVANDRIIARGDEATHALNAALEVATVLAMAEAVGVCEGIISLTAEHAKVREQFGQAIGSFQAVSHPIADMRIRTDACRLLMLEAALLIDQGKPATFEVSSAKVFANEAAAQIALDGHRLHGAIGYSNEYDLQLYTRRAKAFTVAWGDTDAETERAALAIGM